MTFRKNSKLCAIILKWQEKFVAQIFLSKSITLRLYLTYSEIIITSQVLLIVVWFQTKQSLYYGIQNANKHTLIFLNTNIFWKTNIHKRRKNVRAPGQILNPQPPATAQVWVIDPFNVSFLHQVSTYFPAQNSSNMFGL